MGPGSCRKVLYLLPHIFATASAAWTATQYARLGPGITRDGLDGGSTTSALPILLKTTGPVSPTSTSTTTTLIAANVDALITATFTYLFLAPDASATTCSLSRFDLCADNDPTTTLGAVPAINTLVFAPVVIQNPASCTRTSFSYTTSMTIRTGNIPYAIAVQATEPAQAALVTTRAVTLSTNLGGQPVATTQADIYLSASAAAFVPGQVPGFLTLSLLSQCVDPYSFICDPKSTLFRDPWACGPTVYPPVGQIATRPGGSGPQQTGPPTGAAAAGRGLGLLGLLAPVVLTAWQAL